MAEELRARESREGGSLGREQKPCLDQTVFTEGRTENWEAEGKMRSYVLEILASSRELAYGRNQLRASLW